MTAVTTALFLLITVTSAFPQGSLDSDIAKALKKSVTCEKIEIKSKAEENKNGQLKSLLIRFVALQKPSFPADYVTVQYSNPVLDTAALKKSNSFKVKSSSKFNIGILASEQSIKNEFVKTARRSNFQYNKFLIKFTPPYIELEFDIPVGSIPLKDRKLLDKFIINKRLEGYAALRLEVRDNKIFATPVKVIMNHFLVPMTLTNELKKRFNPIYAIPHIRPFDYNLVKVDVLKQHILFSN
jgi:hypothetical protein